MLTLTAEEKALKVLSARIIRISNGTTRLYAVCKDGTVVIASSKK